MNTVIQILGQKLSVFYNWHTTEKLMSEVRKEAFDKGVSINALINTIIYDRYFRNQKITK